MIVISSDWRQAHRSSTYSTMHSNRGACEPAYLPCPGNARSRGHRPHTSTPAAPISPARPRRVRRTAPLHCPETTSRRPTFNPKREIQNRRSRDTPPENGKIQRATPTASWHTHPTSITSTCKGRTSRTPNDQRPLLAASPHAPTVAPRAKCRSEARTNQTLIRAMILVYPYVGIALERPVTQWRLSKSTRKRARGDIGGGTARSTVQPAPVYFVRIRRQK